MEEADKLCDNISIIDHGKIKVTDSPKSLKNALGNEVVVFEVDSDLNLGDLLSELKKVSLVKDVAADGYQVTLFSSSGDQVMPKIFELAGKLGIKIESITLTKPTLDDVFLSYTGRELREESNGYNKKKEREKMRRLRA
jgi:ABC-2 type transport system ATP-binding protein